MVRSIGHTPVSRAHVLVAAMWVCKGTFAGVAGQSPRRCGCLLYGQIPPMAAPKLHKLVSVLAGGPCARTALMQPAFVTLFAGAVASEDLGPHPDGESVRSLYRTVGALVDVLRLLGHICRLGP